MIKLVDKQGYTLAGIPGNHEELGILGWPDKDRMRVAFTVWHAATEFTFRDIQRIHAKMGKYHERRNPREAEQSEEDHPQSGS
jgi:hypothetical protein